jgi:hypothetical protein
LPKGCGLHEPTEPLGVAPAPESREPVRGPADDAPSLLAEKGEQVRHCRDELAGRVGLPRQRLDRDFEAAGGELPAGELLDETVDVRLAPAGERGGPLAAGGRRRHAGRVEVALNRRPGDSSDDVQVENRLDRRGNVVPPGQTEGREEREVFRQATQRNRLTRIGMAPERSTAFRE